MHKKINFLVVLESYFRTWPMEEKQVDVIRLKIRQGLSHQLLVVGIGFVLGGWHWEVRKLRKSKDF